mmetsp:Transcript_55083/g.98271  ORF Transcript_55083/g.98271 Transcript_55083/m.98271 type:complete len:702 (-) Transcript_55083:96-2201(-)|eukprot:CAMPEP_0197656376 /NCGR_PEP_ID=MMETSP1338-20131121/41570_1 /TAXON_ID=43686 ORGANISM="Pelagodinium beii, Strain RCC1491" /NCGR_SAMPLE_ID=MMETSP1338 /ASSEMBLY_ACC=CAM_ASM_000754 /LENGTH=701 /DNA_ID=CAMNT_0043232349 /DNA_START=73 /DNA_END=2178 /DNA_ORIENTATION=+
MKVIAVLVASAILPACSAKSVDEGLKLELSGDESPIVKVVNFMKDLKAEAIADGEAENKSYTAYETWCTETKATCNKDIGTNNKLLDEAKSQIEKVSGNVQKVLTEIAYTKKGIKENLEAQKTATNIREKENKAFRKAKNDLEESIASLKSAGEVLGGVAEKPKGGAGSFLAKTTVASAAVSIRHVLQQTSFISKAPQENQQLLQSFLDLASKAPADASEYKGQTNTVANVIDQSKQDFEADLQEAKDDEASQLKSYNELMTTSKTELADLEKNLQDLETNNADELKTLSDNKMLKTDNEVQLDANTKMLKETTLNCQVKKEQFGTRAKLRADEIAGITEAVTILTDPEAVKKFEGSAAVSFLQTASDNNKRKRAYEALKRVASKYHVASLAQLAVSVQMDAFHEIIDRIDEQIDMLKKEEMTDVRDRDDCQNQLAENEADIATLSDTISKQSTFLDRLNDKKSDLEAKSTQLQKDMNDTKDEMKDRGVKREAQHNATMKALRDDKAALALLEKATAAIKEFSRKNKVDMSLLVLSPAKAESLALKAEPKETTTKHMKAPDAGFDDADYEGQKSASKGLMGLLDMVLNDMRDEVKTGEEDDAEDQKQYEADQKTLNEIFDSKETGKISTDKILGETQDKIADLEGDKSDAEDQKKAEEAAKATLEKNCQWVTDNFATRREKRKTEIDGLIEAKGILAGAAP